MTTAAFVRLALEHYRAEGEPFEAAWVRALQSIPRGPNLTVARERREWVEALRWARPAWEAAYHRAPLEEYVPRARARRVPLELLELLEA